MSLEQERIQNLLAGIVPPVQGQLKWECISDVTSHDSTNDEVLAEENGNATQVRKVLFLQRRTQIESEDFSYRMNGASTSLQAEVTPREATEGTDWINHAAAAVGGRAWIDDSWVDIML